MSQLLSPSESLAFNGFLSAIDLGGVLDGWNALADAVPVPTARGREALSKATKDLMSLEPNDPAAAAASSSSSAAASNWPSLPPQPDPRRPAQPYSYGFGSPAARPPSRHFFSSSPTLTTFTPAPQPSAQSAYVVPRSRSPPLGRFSPSSPFFPSAPESSSSRPAPYAAASAPAILAPAAASSSKRGLPPDSEGAAGPSGGAAKRRRPSAATQPPVGAGANTKPHASRTKPLRSASTSSSTAALDAAALDPNGALRPSLLSPSQKRANHIQSEQKRRANIRKGYEALCEVVPALREAIRLEEEAARAAEDEKEKGRKRKRRAKGGAPPAEEACHAMDGRAGPKSENVVLQKTIDHLHGLLAERDALAQRLAVARAALGPDHPALAVSTLPAPNTGDDNENAEGGVPLWEREWNGGEGWGDEGADED